MEEVISNKGVDVGETTHVRSKCDEMGAALCRRL